MDRLDIIRSRLVASLKPDGTPAKGYMERVAALRAEILRLETARGGDSKDPAEAHPPSC